MNTKGGNGRKYFASSAARSPMQERNSAKGKGKKGAAQKSPRFSFGNQQPAKKTKEMTKDFMERNE